ncbi:DegT/DnrJ/EryC1/StrS family aminotransferase [Lysinibacillus xylanilyticus]|uniref:Aminotransferase n=1 Tax=Lysinibacillus xylanilyticus TaxID=582475 RepID=A0A0K9F528_9BACI|nr:DegT/DnrJ/EryC1/StrS family aminotransferase [Lysinibacillus xylanilyticus]KMY29630.1 aminotransferase [Lysinibacillus xylanilyticus]
MKPIQVTQSSMPDFDEFSEEIRGIWDSRCLTNMGVKHQQLEVGLEQYLKTPNVSLFSNGHLALEYAITALNLTGEVITTPFTFASTTHAIVRNGLTPVFCDIDPNNYTIQTDNLEHFITDKTSAIIPIHVYGNICNVAEINRIAKKYNLKVIYDAAHAFGITIDDEGVANYGDISMFSFHATKVFHTIEGGALTFKDSSLNNVFNAYKNFGITGLETIDYIGGNAKMNEFQAAMGLCNLRNVDQEINKRKKIYNRYLEQLSSVNGIRLTFPPSCVKSNYAYFPILFDGFTLSRDEVHDKLKKHNIFTRKYFYPITNSFECYRGGFSPEETPVAKYMSERILTLPLYGDLKLEEVDKICGIIKA